MLEGLIFLVSEENYDDLLDYFINKRCNLLGILSEKNDNFVGRIEKGVNILGIKEYDMIEIEEDIEIFDFTKNDRDYIMNILDIINLDNFSFEVGDFTKRKNKTDEIKIRFFDGNKITMKDVKLRKKYPLTIENIDKFYEKEDGYELNEFEVKLLDGFSKSAKYVDYSKGDIIGVTFKEKYDLPEGYSADILPDINKCLDNKLSPFSIITLKGGKDGDKGMYRTNILATEDGELDLEDVICHIFIYEDQ